MAQTILGKRARCAADVADAPARSTRAKRRATENAASNDAIGLALSKSPSSPVSPCQKHRGTKASVAAGTKAHSIARSPAKSRNKSKTDASIEVYQDADTNVIPITPRHRDALSKKVAVTPRHRLIESKEFPTPRTSSRSSTAVYNQARLLFSRSSNPGKLVGREEERAELGAFIQQHLEASTGGSLYISGPPGTGKSALVSETVEPQVSHPGLKACTVNCMSIRSTSDLISKLSLELDFAASSAKDLQTYFVPKRHVGSLQQYLVVLDEVDRLVELDLELLYNLFEWSLAPKSRLILIGIANALDLTDRCLPQLRCRNLKPELLPFMPYTAAQITDVLTSKLKSLPGADVLPMPPFVHPTAIQFCSKKIAAQTGDLRKAFDICQRAIDLVEQETIARDVKAALFDSPSKTPLMENINLSSPMSPKSPGKAANKVTQVYTMETAPRATIAHMAKVTSQVFSNGATQRLTILNLQQKAVLCSLAALEKRKRAMQLDRVMFSTPSKADRSAPTTKQLYESYTSLCKRSDMLQALTSNEFRDVVSGLEAQGLVSGADGKKSTFVMPITPSRTPSRKNKSGFAGSLAGDDHRVASVVGDKELRAVLEGAGGELLREIIDGEC